MSVKDHTGNIVPRQFRPVGNPHVKTVFDPNVISNEQMFRWGQEAMRNATIDGYRVVGRASNGLRFEGFFRNGVITNFYPVLE